LRCTLHVVVHIRWGVSKCFDSTVELYDWSEIQVYRERETDNSVHVFFHKIYVQIVPCERED